MRSPIFDFSHLSPEERIRLAEELWDRLERHRKDPGRGRPAEDVLRDIEQRGR